MQAILTKYIAPTNYRDTRVKAACAAGTVTIAYDSGLDLEANHIAAAKALQEKLGRTGKLHTGTIPNGDFVHVTEA